MIYNLLIRAAAPSPPSCALRQNLSHNDAKGARVSAVRPPLRHHVTILFGGAARRTRPA